MQLSLATLLLAAAPAVVRAVFKDEVGHIDYHHELLGVPQRETTFFHQPRAEAKASLLYTLSDLGVVGAVNPGSGALVWRHLLSDNITAASGGGHLRAGQDATWLASALGSSVQAWDAFTGRNVWSLDFPGKVKDLEIMELTEGGRKDVLTLFEEDGAFVARRINSAEGSVVWEFREHGRDVPLQVSTNVEKVFVVSLHGTLLSYSLKITVLDTLTGKRLDDINIGTKGEVQKPSDVMFVGANSAAPIVAWTDNAVTRLKVHVLGTKKQQEFPLIAETTSVEIYAPHNVQAQPHFLVQSRTTSGNKADVFHVDLKTNAISKAYELPLLKDDSAFSMSSSDSNVYFTRITGSEAVLISSASHGVLARWDLTGTQSGLEALHGVSEVIKKSETNYAVRAAVVTSSDHWTLVQNSGVGWTRPEGLSGAVGATWAEISQSEDLARTLDAEAHSNPLSAYIHRVQRHLNDLQYLPAYLQAIPARLASSVLGTELFRSESALTRDSFGFNKLVVLATKRGKLYALDTGNRGRIVWTKDSNETPFAEPENIRSIYADPAKGQVTIRGADGEFIIVAADTGKTVESAKPGLFPKVQSAVVVDSEIGPWLLPIHEDGTIGEVPVQWAPKQTVVVRSGVNELKGVIFEPQEKATSSGEKKAVEVPAWTFTPGPNQHIVHIASRNQHDPVASIGRVLGDRTVKYKYLNPNTFVVSALDNKASRLTVYLLDSVSGQILSTSTYEGVDVSKDISCTIAENWFVCSFFGQYLLRDAATASQSMKGYQVVVSDMYESDLANDRGPLGDIANFSSTDPIDQPTGPALPSILSKTYVLSSSITALAVTQTRQGITTRELLAYVPDSHSIVSISRMVLEPRRTVGRDPTPVEVEEGLSKYIPAIDLDGRMMITHQRDVLGIRSIITSPAVLESTSLVFAYGIDIFGTRVSPSFAFDVLGKGFNKVALIGTVLALTVGVVALGPFVRKSVINMRWKAIS